MNVHRTVPCPIELDRPLAPSRERQRMRLTFMMMIMDVAAIYAGFLVVGKLYLGNIDIAWGEAALISPLYLLFGLHGGLYRSDLLLDPRRAAYKCLYMIVVSAMVLVMLSFYVKATQEFSRVVLTSGCAVSLVLLIASRATVSTWLRRTAGQTLTNTLIIYAGGPDIDLEGAFHIDALERGIRPDTNDPVNLDRIGRYMENMDRVIISCSPEDRNRWVPLLRAAGVEGEFVSTDLWQLGALEIRREPGFTGIVVSARPLPFEALAIKRTMDLVLSSLALLILAPLMATVAVLIRLEDGGPVLFKQRRMGASNRFFWIYKFRSMRVERTDPDGERSASRDDDRTTRIGKFIRRTSIDELPQLFNVWRGEMSLVGPRPHAIGSQAGDKHFWEIDGRYWSRHVLKPGLTGLAQIRGLRGATVLEQDLSDRLGADLEYISRWSIWLDVIIILRTFRVIMHDRAF